MKDLTAQNTSFTEFRLNGFYSLGEWRPFLFIPFFLMFMLAIIANSILIYLIKTQRSLHSPMYVLIGVMAVVDLIMPLSFVPNMLLSFLFNWSGISLTGCLMQMFGIHFVGSFQVTLLFWMALDRYFAICKPLYYHKYMEMSNFLKFVFAPVIRNALLIVTMVSLAGRLSFCATNIIDHSFCEHMALVQLACGDISANNIVGLLSAFLIAATDCILITVSYIVMFFYVLKSGTANMKALNTCVTHLIVLSISLTSALTAFLSYRIRNNLSSNNRIFISTVYLFFPSCLHPLIYGWRTKEIRQTFLQFIHKAHIFPLEK
ncbi:odorant receptor 113-1 [Danio rerio]|uniref:Odorant receptor n=1 Tax=Danio rerio TaxID=7955 RepID=Q2PRE5_DANRE|nr:odorant receptor 113-1 [Danio rerio]ABC43322.1 odorant receptor [Danio rerio]|eukprot:NP_001124274.1 odorant receptor, family A, subfamily 113, member 1 [Danio rerio]